MDRQAILADIVTVQNILLDIDSKLSFIHAHDEALRNDARHLITECNEIDEALGLVRLMVIAMTTGAPIQTSVVRCNGMLDNLIIMCRQYQVRLEVTVNEVRTRLAAAK